MVTKQEKIFKQELVNAAHWHSLPPCHPLSRVRRWKGKTKNKPKEYFPETLASNDGDDNCFWQLDAPRQDVECRSSFS